MSGSVDLGGRRIIKKIFFKQKTAYEIVTGDWSSDVCSSDLEQAHKHQVLHLEEHNLLLQEKQKSIMARLGQIGRASCRERV